MINILAFIELHPFLFLVAIVWLVAWKGLVLWKSARRNQVFWFLIFLVLNTLSIGEMIYYLWLKSQDRKDAK